MRALTVFVLLAVLASCTPAGGGRRSKCFEDDVRVACDDEDAADVASTPGDTAVVVPSDAGADAAQPDTAVTPDAVAPEACTSDADCDDKSPCTSDVCGVGGVCKHLPAGGPCDDGNPCTLGDACAAGVCTGTIKECQDGNGCTNDFCDPATGACSYPDNTDPCDDGDLCTNGDVCKAGACSPGKPVPCDDGEACTTDACVSATGKCTHTSTGEPCNDGSACTVGDFCQSGKCKAGSPKDCDDQNACTGDSCDKGTGSCKHDNNTLPCSDNDACTVGDVCAAGTCKSGAQKACDDGDKCTTLESCSGGKCQPGIQKTCDDGDGCTNDYCTAATGVCKHDPGFGFCDDLNPCTGDDQCTPSGCKGTPGTGLFCDDGNACTDDACTPGGCSYGWNVLPCDDFNACTNASSCLNGSCFGVDPVSCDDANLCTDDWCANELGCQHAQKYCDDGQVCSLDSCDPATGQCISDGGAGSCDDGIACSVDACVFGKGCVHTYPEGCCEPKLISATFDDGLTPAGWSLTGGGGGVQWQVVTGKEFVSESGSLYYGNPAVWNFDGGTTIGVVNTPEVTLPAGKKVLFSFAVWAQIEGGTTYDQLSVTLQPSGQLLWMKDSSFAMGVWTPITVDLSPHAGETVSLRITFNTIDGAVNSTTGVFFDDITLLGCDL